MPYDLCPSRGIGAIGNDSIEPPEPGGGRKDVHVEIDVYILLSGPRPVMRCRAGSYGRDTNDTSSRPVISRASYLAPFAVLLY